ncbi:hypothetical protein ACS15_0121 [Ralstonia insidiosa]|uniref:MoxR-vWA-beta-propeller ternary system domain-containing protein n=1 Tax=Ralstonia insidiosa TaxID=190721 RepID=A0AAC9BGK4_9RALS|nr:MULTISPECIES: bpX6 domain-containing protein [Ralstonia]ANH73816.1 hypothetical protein ACS15_0121 [Ralstonia insidiosa]EPX96355.1 hypothetical protein C404_19255 [Ralstonia sp. AU12-08]MBY4707619.1 hypothetical protein [Ralstonia insidiosa]GAQ28149.1 hypothetical protein SAMD00023378_1832 [Ralstonia sp. NT80]
MWQPDVVDLSCIVQQPSLSGHVDVAGLWFPADWFDLPTRRRRMLAHWQPRARAFSFAQGDLLSFATPQRCDSAALPGWPLILHGRTLSSAMLSDTEAAALPVADVWVVTGARVLSLHLRDAVPQDPSQWIAAGDYGLLDTYDCRTAQPEPVVEIGAGTADVRKLLGDKVPAASAQQASFLRELQAAASAQPLPPASTQPLQRSAGRWRAWWPLMLCVGVVAALVAYVLRDADAPAASHGNSTVAHDWLLALGWVVACVVVLVKNPWSVKRPSSGSGGPAREQARPAATAPAGRTISARAGQRLPQRWRDWLARAALFTRVSNLLGRQHAAYLRRMMALFEDGQLDEALRHAIPLGGEQGSLGQSFAALQARRDLALSRQLGTGPSVHLGDEIGNYLKQLYRKSFEKLDREGRIDEAVFVLAELLQSRQEALDYLEKHARYKQAAELALAWDRPSDVIVRLYCLAGDWRVAVAVARRDRAFANAVLMLEKKWPDPARQLRLEWAQALAAQGDWLGAIDVAWQVPEARERAAQWLQHAEADGGTLAARALVQRAQLLPDTLSRYESYLSTLREDGGRHRERAALVQALLAVQKKGPALASLARAVMGAVLADQARGVGALNRKMVQNLINLTGDRLLQADLPNAPLPVPEQPEPLNRRTPPLELEAPDAGTRGILDAVPLEGDRYLVALGEAGAAVVNAHGVMVARFAVPAEMLVIADSGQVALALARRGDLWRVSRIELAARRVQDLGVMPMDHCAMQFDGIAWTVVHDVNVRVLDVSQTPCAILWQVTDLPGHVVAFTRTPHLEQLLIRASQAAYQLWRYSLPQRRLLARDDIAAPADGETLLLDSNNGSVRVGPMQVTDGVPSLPYVCSSTRHLLGFEQDGDARPVGFRLGVGWLTLSLRAGDGCRTFRLQAVGNATDRVRLRWPAVEAVCERFAEKAWLAFDETGRLVHVDLVSGEVRMLSIR